MPCGAGVLPNNVPAIPARREAEHQCCGIPGWACLPACHRHRLAPPKGLPVVPTRGRSSRTSALSRLVGGRLLLALYCSSLAPAHGAIIALRHLSTCGKLSCLGDPSVVFMRHHERMSEAEMAEPHCERPTLGQSANAFPKPADRERGGFPVSASPSGSFEKMHLGTGFGNAAPQLAIASVIGRAAFPPQLRLREDRRAISRWMAFS